MDILSLKCPHCGATLETEDGLDTFFCKYCGGKIHLDGMSKDAYKARVRVKEMEHEERQKDKDYEQERFKIEHKEKQRKRDDRSILMVFLIMFLVPILGFSSIAFNHHREIQKLERIEYEVKQSIDEGDYDTALFKANQLRVENEWSDEQTEAWNAKREAYIELIKEKQRQAAFNNPDKLYMPLSSSDYKGEDSDKAKDQLLALGFTNVKTQASSKEAGWFHDEGDIEHIIVDGKTKFSNEDFFDKNVEIIIYYYTE